MPNVDGLICLFILVINLGSTSPFSIFIAVYFFDGFLFSLWLRCSVLASVLVLLRLSALPVGFGSLPSCWQLQKHIRPSTTPLPRIHAPCRHPYLHRCNAFAPLQRRTRRASFCKFFLIILLFSFSLLRILVLYNNSGLTSHPRG